MKRLRIVQQIIIIILFAVIVPFITIGLIISNVSQQSVRRELNLGATSFSKYIAKTIEGYVETSSEEFSVIALAVKNIPKKSSKLNYLSEIEQKNKFTSLKIIQNSAKQDDEFEFDQDKKTLKLYAKIDDNYVLEGNLFLYELDSIVKDKIDESMHYIFVLDENLKLVTANNENLNFLNYVTENLPKQRVINKSKLFSIVKNQPLSYFDIANPNWTIVVMTHPQVTRNTIDKAREKIILCLLIAAICIFSTVGLYTYYLYINIRQLFKGITAISKGSYDRKIRLLKSIFTPFEIVFLEKEFNYMTQKVSKGYSEISEKNAELNRLNKYRDSLVSAVSHEFRTPLTSIIGYSSRLVRGDIEIDEKTRKKSLHIIIQQAQRLSRMVDDLLTIPDIESFHLSISKTTVDLLKVVELSIEYSNNKDTEFKLDVDKNLWKVYADYDRLIQIVVNLFDNAVKYNIDNDPIKVSLKNSGQNVLLTVENKSENIPDEILDKLYDKFIRLDSKLTRTTRGTGLGLYIVKGLCDAMDIKISIENKNETFKISLLFKGIVDDKNS